MKKTAKKLEISKETLRRLTETVLDKVQGGAAPATHEYTCDASTGGSC